MAQLISGLDDSGIQDFWPSRVRTLPSIPERLTAVCSLEDAKKAGLESLIHACEQVPHESLVLLSGGLDSSLLLAILVHIGKRPIAATMVSRFPAQNEWEQAHELCIALGVEHHSFSIDSIPLLEDGGVHQRNLDLGLGLYAGLAYEAEFARFASTLADHLASGVWADQLFSPGPFEFLERGVACKDEEMIDAALEVLNKRALRGFLMAKNRTWRRLRTTPSWQFPEGWLHLPVESGFIDPRSGWRFEMMRRTMLAIERESGATLQTPYLNEDFIKTVNSIQPGLRLKYSINKKLLREIAAVMLPGAVSVRPKGGYFTPVVTHFLKTLSQKQMESWMVNLQPLFRITPGELIDSIGDFSQPDSSVPNFVRALVIGHAAEGLQIV